MMCDRLYQPTSFILVYIHTFTSLTLLGHILLSSSDAAVGLIEGKKEGSPVLRSVRMI